MKKLLLPLIFLSVPAFGHGFAGWQAQEGDKVRFAFQVNADCPVVEPAIFEREFVNKLAKHGLKPQALDPNKPALVITLDCFEDGNIGGFPFYMAVSLGWPQSGNFPFLDLVYYYGQQLNPEAVEQQVYRMMTVGIERYIAKVKTSVTE